MKKYEDEVIYIYLEPSDDYLITCASSSDSKKYYISNLEDITTFLRYLVQIKACEIVGNVYIDKNFVKEHKKDSEYYDKLKIEENKEIIKKNFDNFIKYIIPQFNEYLNESDSTQGLTIENIKLKSLKDDDVFKNRFFNLELDININIDFEKSPLLYDKTDVIPHLNQIIKNMWYELNRQQMRKDIKHLKFLKSGNKDPKCIYMNKGLIRSDSDPKQLFNLSCLVEVY